MSLTFYLVGILLGASQVLLPAAALFAFQSWRSGRRSSVKKPPPKG